MRSRSVRGAASERPTAPWRFAEIAMPVPGTASLDSIAASLRSDRSVATEHHREVIRLRALRPTELAGMPMHFGPRGTFHGQISRDEQGQSILWGSIEAPGAAPVSTLAIIGLAVAFALAGAALVAAGDLSAVLLLVVAAVALGVALVNHRLWRYLAGEDRRTLVEALERAVGPEPI